MKITQIIAIIIILGCIPLFSEELNRVESKTETGENLTVVTFKNEPDGLIRREIFGDETSTRIRIDYYDDTNTQFEEKAKFSMIDIREHKFIPDGVYTRVEVTYRKEKPNKLLQADFFRSEKISIAIGHYETGNKFNLSFQLIIVNLATQKKMVIHERYADQSLVKDGVSEKVFFYDENEFLIEKQYVFYPNESGMITGVYQFKYPEYTDEKLKPFYQFHEYKNHPRGALSQETLVDSEEIVHIIIFDPTKSENKVEKQYLYQKNNKTLRDTRFFTQNPVNGNITVISRIFHSDETVKSIYFYDANDVLVFEHNY